MFEDLDPTISSAFEALRREFDDKLERQRIELERLLGAPADIEGEPVPPEPAAGEPEPVALDPLEELKLAAAGIDEAESQADVLDALIRASRRFASRSALFLHRAGSLEGWGGNGFGAEDSTITGLSLSAPPDSPWQQVTSGVGGVTLARVDCALLSDRLGVEGAEVGILVPFILQDQVAAVLYADRVGSTDVFNVSGLQLLSFIAGQTVETLPVRDRQATASLRLAATDVDARPAPVAPPPAPEPIPELQPEPEPAAVEPEEMPVEPPETSAAEPAPTPPTPEPEPEPELEPPTSELAGEAESFAEPEPTPEPPPEEASEPASFETAPEPAPDLESPAVSETAKTIIEPSPLADESPTPVADGPDTDSPQPETPFSPPVPTEAPAPVDTVAGEVVTPIEPPPVEEASPPVSESEPPIDAGSSEGTEVKPPTDVEGPGWAFTTTKIPTAGGAEAQHEEARRLARLLVTEIKLYNEEVVEEGRAAGDIHARLKEDIDRSRQIFEDRIDPEVRNEKDYFHEALVRILAGGDASALGT